MSWKCDRVAVCLAIIVIAALQRPALAQTVWYVDADSKRENTCVNWDNACTDLQIALGLAQSGDQIWVAAGTYRPAPPGGDRTRSFELQDGVAVYGGFAGGELVLDERDPSTNLTILTGDLNGDDDTMGDSENSYHVVTATNIPSSPNQILEGFTITAGNADGVGPSHDAGAGIDVIGGSPIILQCIILSNNADTSGAGIRLRGSNATLTLCTLQANTAPFAGGMDSIQRSTPKIIGCDFVNNLGGVRGGALVLNDSGNAEIVNCRFFGNSSSGGGAIWFINSGFGRLTNCVFSGNVAGNSAGGALLNNGSSFIMSQCTFFGNTTTASTGAALLTEGNPTISNSIFWNNTASGVTDQQAQIEVTSGTPAINYSTIQGWIGNLAGVGNNGLDPLFRDADGPDLVVGTEDDDLRLLPGSPCIDAADNTSVPTDVVDLDADGDIQEFTPLDLDLNPRFIDDPGSPDSGVSTPSTVEVVDRGAYESPADCDGDGVADACEIDCGQPDKMCDVPGCGTDTDCNINGIPDSCELDSGVSYDTHTQGTGDRSLVIPAPPGIATGDLLLATITHDEGSETSSPAGWEELLNAEFHGSYWYSVFYKIAQQPEPSTYTFTWGKQESAALGAIFLYERVDPTNPIGDFQHAGGTDSTPSAPAATSIAPNSMVVRIFTADEASLSAQPFPSNHTGRLASEIGGGDGNAASLVAAAADIRQRSPGNTNSADFQLDEDAQWRAATVVLSSQELDCDGNGTLDECDDDCNANGTPDDCEGLAGVCGLTRLYVDADAIGKDNGTSWQNAFIDLQSALAFASGGGAVTEIWVAQGTYVPGPPDDRQASFNLVSGVTIYGGFAVGDATLADRDVEANRTILSGDLLGDDIPAEFPSGMSRADNSYTVITADASTDSSAILDGFAITAGNANDDGPQGQLNRGGGLFIEAGTPSIRNCTFVHNSATGNSGDGGAVFDGGGASFVDCLFLDNHAADSGGAIRYGLQETGVIARCTFLNNSADSRGGAFYALSSTCNMVNCKFIGNRSLDRAGAIQINGDNGTSFINLTNCLVVGNTAGNQGGALRIFGGVDGCTAHIAASTFSGNAAPTGGVFYVIDGGTGNAPALTNTFLYGTGSVIWDNQTFLAEESSPEINFEYCHIPDGNGANGNLSSDPLFVGALFGGWTAQPLFDADSVSTTFTDSSGTVFPCGLRDKILNPDVAQSRLALIIDNTPTTVTVAGDYSDLGGAGDAYAIHDYHLQPGSTAIDSADNAGIPADAQDLDGDGNPDEPLPLDLDGLSRFVDDPATDDSDGVSDPENPKLPIADRGPYEFRTDCNADGLPDLFDTQGSVVFVRANATPAGSGDSALAPISDVNEALCLAQAYPGITEIRIAAGTYTPGPPGDRCATFELINNVAIIGGYSDDFSERAPALYQTMLSGDLLGDDLDEDFPADPSQADNCYHVITAPPGIDTSAVLDGLTISGGSASFDVAGNPLTQGGGLYIYEGAPRVHQCDFIRNSAMGPGGDGGAVFSASGTGLFEECRFVENQAAAIGGAIRLDAGGTATMVRSDFVNNLAGRGGAIGSRSPMALTNCRFLANDASTRGGALFLQGSSAATVHNGLFLANVSGEGAAVVLTNNNASLTLRLSTLTDNHAVTDGGGIRINNGSVVVENSILWGNSDATGSGAFAQMSGSPVTIVSSCVQDDFPGDGNIPFGGAANGNIDLDPLFRSVMGVDSDIRLQGSSPCIDVGDNALLPLDTADLDNDLDFAEIIPIDILGQPRLLEDLLTPDAGMGPIVDMGAAEFLRDCNDNGVPDEQDLANCPGDPGCSDCNANNVPDSCDIADCVLGDAACDDCNLNNIPDACDIAGGQSIDGNPADGVPDECVDAEANGVWSDELVWNFVDVPKGSEPYPDNGLGVPDLSVTLDGQDLLLDVNVQIPTLRLINNASLAVTSEDPPKGALPDLIADGNILLEGLLTIADGRSITANATFTVAPDGSYTAACDPDTEVCGGSLSADEVRVVGGDAERMPGSIELVGDMSLYATGDLVLELANDEDEEEEPKGSGTPPIKEASDAASVIVDGNLILIGGADLTVSSSIPIRLAGSFLNHATREYADRFDWKNGALEFNSPVPEQASSLHSHAFVGTGQAAGALPIIEAAGVDLGPFPGFLESNFVIGTLIIGSGTDVQVVDNFDNQLDGLAQCDEALYVDNLIVEPGADLLVNEGCRVYYRCIEPPDLGLNSVLPFFSPSDVNADTSVNAADLALLLGSWGSCVDCADCPADFNGDCEIDAADLSMMLGTWTSCP